jgi:hypothetical protein
VGPYERPEQPEPLHQPKTKHASLIDKHGVNLT